MKEMNEVPADQMKIAITEMNKLLAAGKKIKTVGAKKLELCTNFKNAVEGFVADNSVEDLPDTIIDFFNEFIADEDESENGAEKETSEKKSNKTKKSGVKNTGESPADKKEKKERTPRGETKKSVCIELLKRDGGASLEEMGKEITKRGIDSDTAKNTKTAGLWMRKIGFPVKKLENGNYIASDAAPAKKDAKAAALAKKDAKAAAPAKKTIVKKK